MLNIFSAYISMTLESDLSMDNLDAELLAAPSLTGEGLVSITNVCM